MEILGTVFPSAEDEGNSRIEDGVATKVEGVGAKSGSGVSARGLDNA